MPPLRVLHMQHTERVRGVCRRESSVQCVRVYERVHESTTKMRCSGREECTGIEKTPEESRARREREKECVGEKSAAT